MKNRITSLFQRKDKNLLSIYFTAGYPGLNDTQTIISELEKNGADLIEIGMPFSDPVADGVVIQQSSETALKNGMTVALLFEQLKEIRKSVSIPLILMGYLNPVMQYGIVNFCKKCNETGIDGTIIPDLPLEIYEAEYKELFEANSLSNIFMVTPQSYEERIIKIDKLSNGFIYIVSSASTTGTKNVVNDEQISYFERIRDLNLRSRKLIGFGISDQVSFDNACRYSNGAIIGSTFIKALAGEGEIGTKVKLFFQDFFGNGEFK
jgi:tryptophan synthase alpha chain